MKSNIENDNIQKKQIPIKITIIGKDMIGKTIFLSIITNKFNYSKNLGDNYLPTFGANHSTKNLTINNFEFILNIWDTCGQERFKMITQFFYINADIILMFYDSLDKSSFERIKEHFINSKKTYSKNDVFVNNDTTETISDEELLGNTNYTGAENVTGLNKDIEKMIYDNYSVLSTFDTGADMVYNGNCFEEIF